jgi:hypothetical protein
MRLRMTAEPIGPFVIPRVEISLNRIPKRAATPAGFRTWALSDEFSERLRAPASSGARTGWVDGPIPSK